MFVSGSLIREYGEIRKMETRNADRIYLLGHDECQIIGSKLPSNGQVLRVLFYNVRKVKLDLRPSAAIAIKEVEVFWDKARIPIRETHHSIDKLLQQNTIIF